MSHLANEGDLGWVNLADKRKFNGIRESWTYKKRIHEGIKVIDFWTTHYFWDKNLPGFSERF